MRGLSRFLARARWDRTDTTTALLAGMAGALLAITLLLAGRI